ncbi:Uncharacterized protein RNJ44_01273 [Nakaseomyces bracarensis]|uniref:UDP-galactose transporter homolog 1 n=1 Tax=Nakaseomyces bracarensis TaxID=273131 RepID=A0ABR4NRE9_9SACH
MRDRSILPLLVCSAGIYISFLTWALVQEPLTTQVWQNSNQRYQCPNVIAVAQAIAAMCVGFGYLRVKVRETKGYSAMAMVRDYAKPLCLVSFTQSASTPLSQYALQYVDYLTYMLAKSCKMIPVLLVHLIVYRTRISGKKSFVAILVSIGVTLFTIGGSKKKSVSNQDDADMVWKRLSGFLLLFLSLFMDGLTNATQDKMMKNNRIKMAIQESQSADEKKKHKEFHQLTGAHMMFALNLFVALWNIAYLVIFDRRQWYLSQSMIQKDPEILTYLLGYALCGSLGQCFIFYTLELYGSLVLIMITVTRKMMSMLLSIVVFGKTVNLMQWTGIFIVFSGISWEALNKRREKKALDIQKKKSE